MRHQARTVLGFVLIGIGLLGLVLPLMPGIPLLIAGVALVGTNHPWIKPLKEHLTKWRARMTRTNHPDTQP